ncbi:MAG: hypothetical protein KDC26_05645 [Armatimonadetes bacterium]|nr:hypothetical protein [Armatimonadota bacterium]
MQQVDPYQSETKKTWVALGVGVSLLVLLVALGFGTGVLGFNQKKNQQTLSQSGEAPNSVLPMDGTETESILPSVSMNSPSVMGQEGNSPDPVLEQEGQQSPPILADTNDGPPPSLEKTTMPADVRDWLEHLRKTDRMMQSEVKKSISRLTAAMARDQVSALTGAMSEDAAGQDHMASVRKEIENFKQKSGEIRKFYYSVRPPSECSPIHASYSTSLEETLVYVVELQQIIVAALSDLTDDPSGLDRVNDIQAEHTTVIDRERARTDELVEKICNKYGVVKWFSIKEDIGGGLGGGLGGLGGLGDLGGLLGG